MISNHQAKIQFQTQLWSNRMQKKYKLFFYAFFFAAKSQVHREDSSHIFHSSEHKTIQNFICMFLWRKQDRHGEDQKAIFKKTDRLLFRSIKHVLSERKFQHPVVQCSSSPLFSVWPLSRTSTAYFQKQELLLIGCQES